jgi:phage shock protein E
MKLNSILIFITVLLGIYVGYQYAVASPYRISSENAKQRLQQKQYDVVLDVRTTVERDTLGFYPRSIHIPSADIEREMPKRFPNKNIRILVYCNTGHRARAATDKLQALGYRQTQYISSTYTTLI